MRKETAVFASVIRDGLAKLSRFPGSCMHYQVSPWHKSVLPFAAFTGTAQWCEFQFSSNQTVAGGMQLLGVSGSLVTLEPYITNH